MSVSFAALPSALSTWHLVGVQLNRVGSTNDSRSQSQSRNLSAKGDQGLSLVLPWEPLTVATERESQKDGEPT